MSASDLLTVTASIFNYLWPVFGVIAGILIGIGLVNAILREIRGDNDLPPRYEKLKNDEYAPMDGIGYFAAHGYLTPIVKRKNDEPTDDPEPKRKNDDQPIRLGDDGELIFPDHYHNHIED